MRQRQSGQGLAADQLGRGEVGGEVGGDSAGEQGVQQRGADRGAELLTDGDGRGRDPRRPAGPRAGRARPWRTRYAGPAGASQPFAPAAASIPGATSGRGPTLGISTTVDRLEATAEPTLIGRNATPATRGEYPFMDHGWRPGVIEALDVVAEIALFQRQHERAVRLSAAAHKQRSLLGLVAFPPDQKRTERNLALAGTALGDENLKKAFDEGTRLSVEDAVAYAQGGRGEHPSATHGWASLSSVERQVVELASQGLSNPDIARELFMSRNAVKAHLSHAYAKLGVANRTELARLACQSA